MGQRLKNISLTTEEYRKQICLSKKYFNSEKTVKGFLKHHRKMGKITDRSRPYKCDVCKGWHITTKENKYERTDDSM